MHLFEIISNNFIEDTLNFHYENKLFIAENREQILFEHRIEFTWSYKKSTSQWILFKTYKITNGSLLKNFYQSTRKTMEE